MNIIGGIQINWDDGTDNSLGRTFPFCLIFVILTVVQLSRLIMGSHTKHPITKCPITKHPIYKPPITKHPITKRPINYQNVHITKLIQ